MHIAGRALSGGKSDTAKDHNGDRACAKELIHDCLLIS
jgi:hypothetical protein